MFPFAQSWWGRCRYFLVTDEDAEQRDVKLIIQGHAAAQWLHQDRTKESLHPDFSFSTVIAHEKAANLCSFGGKLPGLKLQVFTRI